MNKYDLIVQDIKQDISLGTYPAYSRLPSVAQLCQQYEVSKITINKAREGLEQQGLIFRRKGSGTFVKKLEEGTQIRPSKEVSGQMEGFMAEVHHPSEYIAKALDISPEDFVYHIVRVRIVDDVSQVIEYTYMPISLIPNLKMKHLEHSIYAYIENTLELRIANAHRVIRAVMPTTLEAKRLSITPNEPLLEVEQIGYIDDGRAFEYSVARHAHGYEFMTISMH